jgi:hypothetical protein
VKTKKLLAAALCSLLAVSATGLHASSAGFDRSVNNLGKVIKAQRDVPITRLSHMLLPDGWLLSYMTDDMRSLVVSWDDVVHGSRVSWHDALRQVGRKEHLVFLVDGAEKQVYVTYPGYGRNPGVEIINSSSVVFQEDTVTQEIIKRAKANEMNYKRRQIQEDLGRFHTQKSELASQLAKLNEERQRVEQQLARLSQSTSQAVSVVESAQRDAEIVQQAKQIQAVQEEVVVPANSADFVFYVRTGLVLADNAKRFAKDIGYEVMVIDKKVPVNCDWPQEIEYSISAKDSRRAFAEYVAPYGFKTNFTGSMVELIYIGASDSFRGCA